MKKQTPSKPTCKQMQAGKDYPLPDFNTDDFTDYVAFHTKCDISVHGDSVVDEKMSLKKCRFCS